MGKAINSIINKSEEANDDRNVVRLEFLNMLHPKGGTSKAIIKKSGKNPHTKVVTQVREVTYLYDNEKVSKGYEIVTEFLVPLSTLNLVNPDEPTVVEEVTRDLRTKEQPK